jgi:hypothetical protein
MSVPLHFLVSSLGLASNDGSSMGRTGTQRIAVMFRTSLIVALIMAGCGIELCPWLAPAILRAAEEAEEGHWVASDNNLLALRCYAEKPHIARGESIRLIVEVRNEDTKPITVLRPSGDWFAAQTSGLKLWNADRRLKYAGPIPTYVVGAGGFVTLAPGERHKDTLELHVDNFPGNERAGRYTLRFDYSYYGQWDVYAEKGGVTNAWRGHICSREFQVDRE